MANVWWVNQKDPVDLFLWIPLKDKLGRSLPSWDAVRDARVGDIVLHYTDQYVVGVSVVTEDPVPMKDPFDRGQSSGDIDDGTFVELWGDHLDRRIHRDDIPLRVRQRASSHGEDGPFQANGAKVKQGYLFPVGDELWDWLTANNEQLSEFGAMERDGSLKALLEDVATDTEVSAIARREQAALRKGLLGDAQEGKCGICGKIFPERYLHAAHIKKRADASTAERLDPNIAMLACLFGCDQAFECGDLLVMGDGTIRLRDPGDPFLHEAFSFLEGATAPAHSEENAHYFAARTASSARTLEE